MQKVHKSAAINHEIIHVLVYTHTLGYNIVVIHLDLTHELVKVKMNIIFCCCHGNIVYTILYMYDSIHSGLAAIVPHQNQMH